MHGVKVKRCTVSSHKNAAPGDSIRVRFSRYEAEQNDSAPCVQPDEGQAAPHGQAEKPLDLIPLYKVDTARTVEGDSNAPSVAHRPIRAAAT